MSNKIVSALSFVFTFSGFAMVSSAYYKQSGVSETRIVAVVPAVKKHQLKIKPVATRRQKIDDAIAEIRKRIKEKKKTQPQPAKAKKVEHADIHSPGANISLKEDPVFRRWAAGWSPEAIQAVKNRYSYSINNAANLYGVSPKVILSVVIVESSGKNIRGDNGEVGPMQLMPSTGGKYVERSKLAIPHYNIIAGTAYLADLQVRYNNDPSKTALAYNRGTAPQKVDPNDPYLKRFLHLLRQLKKNT